MSEAEIFYGNLKATCKEREVAAYRRGLADGRTQGLREAARIVADRAESVRSCQTPLFKAAMAIRAEAEKGEHADG